MRLGFPPEYVMDKMQFYEIAAVMKYSYLKNKDSWEQTRMIAYVTAQVNSTKPLEMTDLIKFEWEKQEVQKASEMTSDRMKAMQERAAEYLNLNNIQDNGTE